MDIGNRTLGVACKTLNVCVATVGVGFSTTAYAQQGPSQAERDGREAMCVQLGDVARNHAMATMGSLNEALTRQAAEIKALKAEIEKLKPADKDVPK